MAPHDARPPADTEPEVLVDINTTPLIDVMLVLLIMFVITIPIQTHAIRMAAPSADVQPATGDAPALKVEVRADGAIVWDGERLDAADREGLEARFAAAAARSPRPELHLKPEPEAAYGHVARVLAGSQRHGLDRIAIQSTEAAR